MKGVRKAAAWLGRKRGILYRFAHVLAPSGVLLSLVALRVSGLPWVETAQHRAFDAFQQRRPRPYEDAPVRVVDIDEESIDKLGQWPWPRPLIGRLVDRLTKAGAASIAFDVLFSEPDRTSPARVVDFWPATAESSALREKAKRLPDHDDLLAAAFKRSRVVTGFVLTGDANGVTPAAKASWAFGGDGPLGLLRDFPGAHVALPALEKAAAGNGGFGFIPEHDAVVRRAPMIFRRGSLLLPSLSGEALRLAQGASGYAVKTSGGSGEESFGAHTGIAKIKVGRLVLPTDEEGRLWIYYTRREPKRTIPAWKVLDPKADLSDMAGVIAFIGTSAVGLKDLRATPLDPAAPGVDVHANAAEQALLGRFLRRPDWAPGAEILFMLVLGGLLITAMPFLGAAWCAWLAALGIFLAVRLPWEAFVRSGYLVDPVFPALSVLVVYMCSSLVSYLKSERERRNVRNAFGQYLHPKLVADLAKHPEKLTLGGETREMTILFCDIRGFTTISEQYDAHGLTQLINRFLTPMTQIIMDRYGYIDKYIGDCIMAFWNAPADDPEHAANACDAALRMQAEADELNEAWQAEADAEGRRYIPLHIGIGLNTGPCCVGNMGADQKFNYSVLGDDVNLSSRLEGQSKSYGVGVVVGPKTRELAPGYAFVELDLIKVKGKTKPVRIHALVGDKDAAATPAFQAHAALHERMLAAYRGKQWDEAARLISECRAASSGPRLEKLYDLYDERVAAYAAAPPPEDWDGAYTATSK